MSLMADRARAGARGFRVPLALERPKRPHDASDSRLWQRGAAQEISLQARQGRVAGLLRLNGAGPWFRSRLDENARGCSTGRLPPFRSQDLDQQFSVADLAIVWAKTDDGAIRGFIVERGTKGLSTPKIEGKFSLRTSPTGEIVLEDCFVPESNLLPKAKGLGGPFGCLNKARFGIVWGAMGAAEFCWHAARRYVLERKQFGRPLAANQLIQKKLADMADRNYTRSLRGSALGTFDGQGRGRAGSHLALEAQQLRQGAGDRPRRPRHARRERYIRRIRRDPPRAQSGIVNTYEGTHDVHALILGRAQTGIQAFS